MKTIYRFVLLCLFALPAFALVPTDLAYTIKQVSDDTLRITLSFVGSDTGETVLLLPDEEGDRKALYQNFHDFNVSGKQKAVMKAGRVPEEKRILHAPHEKLTLTYDLKQSFKGKPMEPTSFFEAIIQHDYFYFLSRTALVLPGLGARELQDSMQTINVHLTWDIPNAWQFASSYGVKKIPEQTMRLTLESFRGLFFMAGEALEGRQQVIHGNTFGCARDVSKIR